MDYRKVYDKIIEKAVKLKRDFNNKTLYTERHHIVPKCLGGKGKVGQWKTHSNIVVLTPKEHFICHKLLCKIHPENKQLAYALWGMCNQKGKGQEKRYTPSSRSYEEAKILFLQANTGNRREDHSNFMKKWWTFERKLNYSENNPMKKPDHSKKISGNNHGSKKEAYKHKWKWSEDRKTDWIGSNNPMFGKTGANHHNSKKVLEIKTGKIFNSLTEISEYLSISKSFMCKKIKFKQGYVYL